MGLIAGLRVRHLDEHKTITSVPFKNVNKNPFRSIYFAVQCMAAELSTASACLLAIQGIKPSVALIVVEVKAQFIKKADGRIFFTCEDNQKAFQAVRECVDSGESRTVTMETTGRLKDGSVVTSAQITWSFKQRSRS